MNANPTHLASASLELLAPAKNAESGMAAIDHGADAVYIGGPAFGARAQAGNTLEDIARLAEHSHRFHARVFVALNTILNDAELEDAQQLVHDVYQAGADALIVQDMGLLELDLPPIQLHASTQTDIRTPEKARFLQDVGFSQIVLARELTLAEIARIRAATDCTLEFFVHGALCVAYSGQCYISHAHTGRSANRGECSQACRLPYSLADSAGHVLVSNQHMLSLKDNDQSANLAALAEAGVRSFKIEGRLKDLSYVKNITAHYRTLLDELMRQDPRYRHASSGQCQFSFTPQPEKTFNRGRTDYFVNDRQTDIGAFGTPKFTGEPIGTVSRLGPHWLELQSEAPLNNGDGLCFYDGEQTLVGMRINRVEDNRLFPAEMPAGLFPGTRLYRNRDQAFERALEKSTGQRKIAVSLTLSETADGFALAIRDAEGFSARAHCITEKVAARDADRSADTLKQQLGKLGGTHFAASTIALTLSQPWFLPTATVNGLRRDAVSALELVRQAGYVRPAPRTAVSPPASYPQTELDYLGNVFNRQALAFYEKHGVRIIEPAYEANQTTGEVSLMITRHCIRYSLNLCPKQNKSVRADPLVLMNGNDKLTLRFDCKPCEMHVLGKLKKDRVVQLFNA